MTKGEFFLGGPLLLRRPDGSNSRRTTRAIGGGRVVRLAIFEPLAPSGSIGSSRSRSRSLRPRWGGPGPVRQQLEHVDLEGREPPGSRKKAPGVRGHATLQRTHPRGLLSPCVHRWRDTDHLTCLLHGRYGAAGQAVGWQRGRDPGPDTLGASPAALGRGRVGLVRTACWRRLGRAACALPEHQQGSRTDLGGADLAAGGADAGPCLVDLEAAARGGIRDGR